MKIRPCAVAGMFYPRDPHHLEQLLEKLFRGKETGLDAKGIVSPHAGYPYSGETAASAYCAIPADFSGTFIVIGPSHRGYQTCISQIPWETPLGIIDVDPDLGAAVDLATDEISHRDEHSLEVQMPFIKYRFPRARILPVLMGDQDFPAAETLAAKVLDAIRKTKRDDIRFVASSDFSHYVPVAVARENDGYAIEALSSLDIPEFYRRISQRRVSACGYGPIAAVCHLCRERGARTGHLIRYATSGDVTGDPDVVGYAAIAVM
ncbi:MAG: AmmeMemoRadiSam system protein B [Methanoregulaceae archaeon]|nr:AmmeMemoRadiSam system protein B [Methanoregulaceae archaeon]